MCMYNAPDKNDDIKIYCSSVRFVKKAVGVIDWRAPKMRDSRRRGHREGGSGLFPLPSRLGGLGSEW